VEAYYAFSPPVAGAIARNNWLRGVVRILLLPIVGFASLWV